MSAVKYPIADLHCDLLCYLAGDASRTAFDPEVRCSIPQLQAGGVRLQTMAVYTRTLPDSSRWGLKQIDAYRNLTKRYPGIWKQVNVKDQYRIDSTEQSILTLLALENASGLCDEEENLDLLFKRLDALSVEGYSPLYIGFTWNEENRFGGGSSLQAVGLKSDGKALLDYMHLTGIALDFSHASDSLIGEALDYIEAKGLQIPIMASHSNFRAVQPAMRNLPDAFALEIAQRGGVIGINFYKGFVGNEDKGAATFLKHLEKACELGIASQLCFGADFFYEDDLPPAQGARGPLAFTGFNDASCYPKLLKEWSESGLFDEAFLEGICWRNFERYCQNNHRASEIV